MRQKIAFSTDILVEMIRAAGPSGCSADALAKQAAIVSRATINRRLAALVQQGAIKQSGAGRTIRYVSSSPFSVEDIAQYFSTDPQSRPVATYSELLLSPKPSIDSDKARRLLHLMALAAPLDKKFLANFLIDFSWGASILEGSTYSDLDTQALILYGERNSDKPVEDAVLILDHKQAIEYLWTHRDLSTQTINKVQSFLTDSHNVPGTEHSDHFLPEVQRGKPREYEDVNLGRSAYYPPFRPGTGYIQSAYEQILATARQLPAIEAAFYLMTRIPYVQVFANGNKRTARLVANLPLLQVGLLPLSFVDFDRQEYIRGMAAFYELGSILIIENVFIRGYIKSIIRSSQIPINLRVQGFDLDVVADALLDYVNSGRLPTEKLPAAFIVKKI